MIPMVVTLIIPKYHPIAKFDKDLSHRKNPGEDFESWGARTLPSSWGKPLQVVTVEVRGHPKGRWVLAKWNLWVWGSRGV